MNTRPTAGWGRGGRTPEARVRWALRFRQLDLARLSEQDRHRAWATLLTWQGGPEAPRAADDGVREAQQALREAIEAFANGLPDKVWVPETGYVMWPPRRASDLDAAAPAPRRVGRQSDQITKTVSEAKLRGRVGAAAVVFALVDDLNAIGADRLKACPLDVNGERCGLIFLARRRQRFCSRRHAVAAAWQRHELKRKFTRRD